MRMLVQRVKKANVKIAGEINGEIDKGLLVFLGIHKEDSEKELDWLCNKLLGLRIFEDENGKMNFSVSDIKGEVLLISQFTLYADCLRGKRPDFNKAAKPDKAVQLYEMCVDKLNKSGLKIQTGKFGADMKVELLNDGPVTLMLEKESF